eukprot:649567-Hanusia_phi.AAC.3
MRRPQEDEVSEGDDSLVIDRRRVRLRAERGEQESGGTEGERTGRGGEAQDSPAGGHLAFVLAVLSVHEEVELVVYGVDPPHPNFRPPPTLDDLLQHPQFILDLSFGRFPALPSLYLTTLFSRSPTRRSFLHHSPAPLHGSPSLPFASSLHAAPDLNSEPLHEFDHDESDAVVEL